MRLLMLTNPGANRVYAAQAGGLAAAELAVCTAEAREVGRRTISGVEYLGFQMDALDDED